MATPSVLTFDAEGRAIDFEVWVDDLQLFLQCDRADGLSLFDLTSGASPAPAADAGPTVRSQWATRDAAARLAVRRHLLCPTLTVDLFEKALMAAEKSIVAIGASRGDLRTPIFEGCSPSCCSLLPLLLLPTPLVLSRSARRLPLAEDAALARARGATARVELERAVEVEVEVEGGGGSGVAVGVVAGEVVVGGSSGGGGGGGGDGGSGGGGDGGGGCGGGGGGGAGRVVPSSGAGLMVVSASSSSSSSSVSGTRSVRGVGVLVRAPTSFVPATARVSSVGVPTPPSAALAA
ncbi:unnamed protein product [Closterium sp. NIES-64]|nr:unnamed protein product [Closterium sp. NIES-64]